MLQKILKQLLLDLRMVIRHHRDQIGNARCWLDDSRMYADVIPGCKRLTVVPDEDEMMRRCARFRNRRQCPYEAQGAAFIPYYLSWDDDIHTLGRTALVREIMMLVLGVTAHWLVGDERRTWVHYHDLYMLLPEQLPAITRLPPNFLEGSVGCRAFHANCRQTGRVYGW